MTSQTKEITPFRELKAKFLVEANKMPGFKCDKDYDAVLELLCMYFTESEQFVNAGHSLRKGIFIHGPVGSGKTSMMRIFSKLVPGKDFRMVSSREVSTKFSLEGHAGILRFGKQSYHLAYSGRGEAVDKRVPLTVCFDDFGAEGSVKYYGNECNVMAEVLMDRYEEFTTTGMVTHLTSNLGRDGKIIEDIYGIRLRSRIREMFNIIELNGDDKRR